MLVLISLHVLIALCSLSLGDEFNLIGDAGQAYAIEVNIGHPKQKMNVLVDTGSTTLAIASYPHQDGLKYFVSENSSTVFEFGKEVQAKYSQGMWVGQLVSDFVQFPSLPIPEIRTNISLIKKSHKFFMNGSGWQGLLGLAYLPVGAWGDNVVVESWLDSVERELNKQISFQLKLCGIRSSTNATHYGKFQMLDESPGTRINPLYQTPILRKRWYEVGVISIRAMTTHKLLTNTDKAQKQSSVVKKDLTMDLKSLELDEEMCQILNSEKSIVDSGTTNIRLPDILYRQVVDKLRDSIENSTVILDDFWFRGEAACWPEPQEWPSLPWLAIDLLSSDSDFQYFTLEIPVQNYMRLVSAQNTSKLTGTESTYCYKLGLEAGGKETVLGYTAMEGLQVLFNRTAGWIGWQMSDCGPGARITGPYNFTRSLLTMCQLTKPVHEVAVSIKAAQWTLCAISIIASAVLVYLLAPCVKNFVVKPRRRPLQISLSQAALVEQDNGA